jgi:aldose 1-epimerase
MYELKSKSLRATFSTLGARLMSVLFDGADMVAGGGSDAQIMAGDWTAGAVCGRTAGRISRARFTLDGTEHRLTANMGEHQLHGGPDNFSVRRWTAQSTDYSLKFEIRSGDGDQGFPGALAVEATYAIDGNVLSLDFIATSDKPTVINLTNHAYWNLAGGARNAFDHEMQIEAQGYLPLDGLLLPTGDIGSVAGTRYDFRKFRRIAENYDNCWALDSPRGQLRHGLTLRDPESGRRMEVWTSESGIQVYTAWHWNPDMPGRNGPLQQFAAVAIEPQNFPDAPNHAIFPSAVLRPGEVYRHRIEWRFSV